MSARATSPTPSRSASVAACVPAIQPAPTMPARRSGTLRAREVAGSDVAAVPMAGAVVLPRRLDLRAQARDHARAARVEAAPRRRVGRAGGRAVQADAGTGPRRERRDRREQRLGVWVVRRLEDA